MENLLIESNQRIKSIDLKFKRYLFENINWKNRLIAIKGARGVGKTTLLLQYLKEKVPADQTVLYVPMDHTYFYENNLLDLTGEFVRNGGKYLFLDEIHKYLNWSRELKLIYDMYPQLNVVFTSSSILDIFKGESDLSRRMVSYELNELSLREYVELEHGVKLPVIDLETLLKDHLDFAMEIKKEIVPIYEFKSYLKWGAYPFFIEGKDEYLRKLNAIVNQILESDLTTVYKLDYGMILKVKKLLFAISSSVPFKPNVSKLSERINVTRPTLMNLFGYLEKALLIFQLRVSNKGISILSKPEMLFLHNTNLIYLFAEEAVNIGNLRETFFLNQLSVNHKINYTKDSDFLVDGKYHIEIGGKNKGRQQIASLENAFIVKDDIETGALNILPLWLFGFLY